MSKPSRLSRIIGAPIRALGRVRDFYVRSMTVCAGQIYHGPEFGYPAAYAMPRSFSVTSSARDAREEDLRELIRASSQSQNRSASSLPPRSRSVAVGRIDEDSPFDFNGGDDLGVGSDLLFPRSRSYATASRQGGVFSRGV